MGIIEENHDSRLNKAAQEEDMERAARRREQPDPEDPLNDPSTDITPEDIELLEEAENNYSSDETKASDLLDDTDEDGTALNEGPDEDNVFDTGEDLDMPDDILNPDHDIDEEDDQ